MKNTQITKPFIISKTKIHPSFDGTFMFVVREIKKINQQQGNETFMISSFLADYESVGYFSTENNQYQTKSVLIKKEVRQPNKLLTFKSQEIESLKKEVEIYASEKNISLSDLTRQEYDEKVFSIALLLKTINEKNSEGITIEKIFGFVSANDWKIGETSDLIQ